MRSLTHLRRSALVLACGLALAAGLSSTASADMSAAAPGAVAAKGQFHWIGAKGTPYFVENPPTGECLGMAEKGRAAQNRTNVRATVYAGKKCGGAAKRLAAGQKAPKGFVFNSVRFGR
ncbi:peptidase inhibitor family I36 protein [Streptomyces sp. NPDC002734]|uniref:peptidase inhibitor family I36 protein n=1 Tax=Streptomyces sp. NPDC002734 TaxID=3154426 RepID=UPI00331FC40B